MEVAPGVHSIPAGSSKFMGMYAPNVFLVIGDRAALIDSGYFDAQTTGERLDYLMRLAHLKLAHILITHPHPDHIGGCWAIREATGAEIAIYAAGAAHLKNYGIAEDRLLADGETLDIGGAIIKVIHTPGHTSDSVCFYLEESGILFTGDHIVGFGTSVIDTPGGDVAQYIESLKHLLNLNIKLICPGHGPLIREPERKIRELIDHRLEREQQVLNYLERGRRSVAELVSEIYPELDERLVELARKQVQAHLTKLVQDGRVTVAGDSYILE
ncbi:MAG: MBL fold metallo-hydrolase [Dehalococcoidia bacterium]|nr:MAG: MBL fold metallo-hydrolase [Dehalococcoidia bacterium]